MSEAPDKWSAKLTVARAQLAEVEQRDNAGYAVFRQIIRLNDEIARLLRLVEQSEGDFTLDDAERLKSLLGVSVLSCDDDIREARRLARKLVERWYPQVDKQSEDG